MWPKLASLQRHMVDVKSAVIVRTPAAAYLLLFDSANMMLVANLDSDGAWHKQKINFSFLSVSPIASEAEQEMFTLGDMGVLDKFSVSIDSHEVATFMRTDQHLICRSEDSRPAVKLTDNTNHPCTHNLHWSIRTGTTFGSAVLFISATGLVYLFNLTLGVTFNEAVPFETVPLEEFIICEAGGLPLWAYPLIAVLIIFAILTICYQLFKCYVASLQRQTSRSSSKFTSKATKVSSANRPKSKCHRKASQPLQPIASKNLKKSSTLLKTNIRRQSTKLKRTRSRSRSRRRNSHRAVGAKNH